MNGFFETFRCYCPGNFWISPNGTVKIVSDVMDHDSVGLSIIEERYEDEFRLI